VAKRKRSLETETNKIPKTVLRTSLEIPECFAQQQPIKFGNSGKQVIEYKISRRKTTISQHIAT
jgi:hypothetical protein